MSSGTDNGIVSLKSRNSVSQTVEKLQNLLRAKGVTLFALVDHSGEAAKAGLKMPNTKLLIFGKPEAGTPVMLAAPSSAIDLPLKLLVAEDAEGDVWVSYNSAEYLRQRHDIPEQMLPVLAVAGGLAAVAVESTSTAGA